MLRRIHQKKHGTLPKTTSSPLKIGIFPTISVQDLSVLVAGSVSNFNETCETE